MKAKSNKTPRKPADPNKLTLRECTVIANYRAAVAWLTNMPDAEYDAYNALPFAERLALYRAQPFYQAV